MDGRIKAGRYCCEFFCSFLQKFGLLLLFHYLCLFLFLMLFCFFSFWSMTYVIFFLILWMVVWQSLNLYVEDDEEWCFDEKMKFWQSSFPSTYFTFPSLLFVVMIPFFSSFYLILLWIYVRYFIFSHSVFVRKIQHCEAWKKNDYVVWKKRKIQLEDKKKNCIIYFRLNVKFVRLIWVLRNLM